VHQPVHWNSSRCMVESRGERRPVGRVLHAATMSRGSGQGQGQMCRKGVGEARELESLTDILGCREGQYVPCQGAAARLAAAAPHVPGTAQQCAHTGGGGLAAEHGVATRVVAESVYACKSHKRKRHIAVNPHTSSFHPPTLGEPTHPRRPAPRDVPTTRVDHMEGWPCCSALGSCPRSQPAANPYYGADTQATTAPLRLACLVGVPVLTPSSRAGWAAVGRHVSTGQLCHGDSCSLNPL